MNKIEEISRWLKVKNVDMTFITSKENILYLTGFNCNPHERMLALAVFQNEAPLLIVPKLDEADAKNTLWEHEVLGIDDTDDTWKMIETAIQKRKKQIESIAIETEHLIYDRVAGLNQTFSNPTFVRVEEKIQSLRAEKSQQELVIMREAARIADHAIEIGAGMINEGKTEMEVLAALEYQLKKEGITKMSFETMVLTGTNAASPHGIPGNTKIQKGDLILFDLGVVVDGYCSDISRTLAFGEVSEKKKEIYNTVLKAQVAACEAIKPGMTCAELDQIARGIITDAGYGQYFTHRLGHGLGISIHEFPYLTSNSDTVITPGMTFTIEPGIYVPEVAGVRIEDDIFVTNTGAEILTKYPKELVIL